MMLLGLAACADEKEAPSAPSALDAGRTEAGPSHGDGAGPDALCEPGPEMSVPAPSAFHVNGDLVYPDPPPTGGNHNPCWGTWGVHDEELADEHWVHNLEHGGVVFLYRCPDGCPDEVSALSDAVQGRDRALLTPYSLLPTRFAVVSWGFRLLSDCFDLASFMGFYTAHVGHGPESLSDPPPAQCL
jgi:hypothetical protein